MRISVVIPVYNEGVRAISTVSSAIRLFKSKIYVVDDGSADNSWDLLKKAFGKNKQVVLLGQIVNLGKGATMKTGAERAFEDGAEAVIFMDGDGQHSPKHLAEFVKALEKRNEIVFGYREFNKDMPMVRKYGNIFARNLVRLLFNINRRDLLSGYIALSRSAYNKVLWSSSRYGIETEIATKIGKKNLKFYEFRIDTIYLDRHKGVSMLDALKILLNIPLWYYKN